MALQLMAKRTDITLSSLTTTIATGLNLAQEALRGKEM
jgi:hypothetical protein